MAEKPALEEAYIAGVDVPRYPKVFWERRFGKAGITLYERAQGIDPREVEPYTPTPMSRIFSSRRM